jgi:hypothetical protein
MKPLLGCGLIVGVLFIALAYAAFLIQEYAKK